MRSRPLRRAAIARDRALAYAVSRAGIGPGDAAALRPAQKPVKTVGECARWLQRSRGQRT